MHDSQQTQSIDHDWTAIEIIVATFAIVVAVILLFGGWGMTLSKKKEKPVVMVNPGERETPEQRQKIIDKFADDHLPYGADNVEELGNCWWTFEWPDRLAHKKYKFLYRAGSAVGDILKGDNKRYPLESFTKISERKYGAPLYSRMKFDGEHFVFKTWVDGDYYYYQAWNEGPSDLIFKHQLWTKIQGRKYLTKEVLSEFNLPHPNSGENATSPYPVAYATRNKKTKSVEKYYIPVPSAFTESFMKVNIVDSKGEILMGGKVTIYVPE